ncbi:MAG: 50S ribosomal protein L23 [Candidatus Kapabacteria bacterium]|nr:50S ribosomal protein L23 [Candidatus Kapabacteria bacterium]
MIEILKRPLLTEKAMKDNEKRIYAFEVTTDCNKIQIKKAVEEMFEVKVDDVRTVRIKGKVKVRNTRKGIMRGRRPLQKKAYVTLKQGQTIEIVSGAANE